MKELKIGDKIAKLPIIQGGMGVGVSLSRLAGAVAKEGGIGIISTAQIGFDEPDFDTNPLEANERAIQKHIKKAKELSNGGIVGVNVMVALKHYAQHVKAAVKAKADVIISGAGLPIHLPKLVEGSNTKIAPIVSSAKAASIILRLWEKNDKRTADFIVIEGPKAGGHLGFHLEQLEHIDTLDYDLEIKKILEVTQTFAKKFQTKIPVILAGGIFSREDVSHALELGVDGVQVATRFVTTKECDAHDNFKQAYIQATQDDIEIMKSPVGMPGRAIRNKFLEQIKTSKIPIPKCYLCLAKCNPKEIPYCITDELTKAVKGDTENGLIFCGTNASKCSKIETVHEVMQDLSKAWEKETLNFA